MSPRKTYSIYTRCDHCGVYDRDPAWCALCGRPKDISRKPGREPAASPRVPSGDFRPELSKHLPAL